MSPREIERVIARMAHQIVEPEDAQDGLVLIGIRRGGEALARRLALEDRRDQRRAARARASSTSTCIATTTSRANCPNPKSAARSPARPSSSSTTCSITGRTVRAALDAVTDLGRPKAIRLAVLVDRGLRELPVQADYVGKRSRRAAASTSTSCSRRSIRRDDSVALVADEERAAT